MASMTFHRQPNRGRQQLYTAAFDRMGAKLPRRAQRPAPDPRGPLPAGIRGYFPRGTDKKTPGYVASGKQ